MDEGHSRNRDGSPGTSLAGILLFFAAVLAATFMAPPQSAAHGLHAADVPTLSARTDPLSRAVMIEDGSMANAESAPAGYGIGCSPAGINLPSETFDSQDRVTCSLHRLMATQPALDISLAPPSPPPIEGLRFQTD